MRDMAEILERLKKAEDDVETAQSRVDAIQHELCLANCERGHHIYGEYMKPDIGTACLYCQSARERGPFKLGKSA